MIFRFSTVFDYDNDSQLRVWTWDKDNKAIKKDAYSAVIDSLFNDNLSTCCYLIWYY